MWPKDSHLCTGWKVLAWDYQIDWKFVFLHKRNVVLRNFKILQSDPETAPISPNPPLVLFKRARNLRNSLPSNRELSIALVKKRCNTYPFINSKTHVQRPKGSYQVNDHFDYTTSNIIYCITYTLYSKLYIVVVWVIVRVCSVVLRRTVVGVDWRFDNLSGSHHIERFQYPCNSLKSTPNVRQWNSCEFVFRLRVRAYVILFVMFVFVGVNIFVTVIVLLFHKNNYSDEFIDTNYYKQT